jgi:hypothetical protein
LQIFAPALKALPAEWSSAKSRFHAVQRTSADSRLTPLK